MLDRYPSDPFPHSLHKAALPTIQIQSEVMAHNYQYFNSLTPFSKEYSLVLRKGVHHFCSYELQANAVIILAAPSISLLISAHLLQLEVILTVCYTEIPTLPISSGTTSFFIPFPL